MNVLVINCGSSSLKYQVINSDTEEVLAKGLCERIGLDGRLVYQKAGCGKEITDADMPTHKQAIKMVLDALVNPETGALKSLGEIGAVGHRMVHGGEKFACSTILNEEVLKVVEECNDLAPLHNPANLIGVRACQELMPNVPMVGVFDTAFHQTMPEKAYLYGIDYDYYQKYGVRKYVFKIFNATSRRFKFLVCHLGNGASICAVKNGKSVDTSMGLTPLEGLIMGTRSGDIDPGAMEYLAKKENIGLEGVMEILNKKSGVQGLSHISSDFRDLEAAAEKNDQGGIRALDTYIYRVAKYVGSYVAAMNGVDVICFTAGVGENGPDTRKGVCEYLGYLGVEIDDAANQVRGEEKVISTPGSKVAVLCMPTNEELAIARETVALTGK